VCIYINIYISVKCLKVKSLSFRKVLVREDPKVGERAFKSKFQTLPFVFKANNPSPKHHTIYNTNK